MPKKNLADNPAVQARLAAVKAYFAEQDKEKQKQDEDEDMFEPVEDSSPFGSPGDVYDSGPD